MYLWYLPPTPYFVWYCAAFIVMWFPISSFITITATITAPQKFLNVTLVVGCWFIHAILSSVWWFHACQHSWRCLMYLSVISWGSNLLFIIAINMRCQGTWRFRWDQSIGVDSSLLIYAVSPREAQEHSELGRPAWNWTSTLTIINGFEHVLECKCWITWSAG